ncbi:uncharacterized protein Z520_03267 [Fonsecaea multimorphosa CBS 102226]|uniref:Uncharacterized protein n=1 Tax=Fonsecaea multimorphosa CBS 102226 TaxID=1442371 RepID=A0A0D2KV31_9EURO|nr:uncharacterized protein Z520_03267 [Fonsecaea multimorphosa CBS 102226]KIY00604.1 hypothetical protein Z520_03267 [Fonsecaea multimorphosa CBS 102226]OAL18995.1 hypothetical protein AYO22_10324 [Fonsecaea multimorphosa]
MSNSNSNQATTRQQQGSGGNSYGTVFYSSSASFSTSTSSSTGGGDPQTRNHAQRYTETMTSNDRDGTNIRRLSEETGRAPRSEETYIPPRGGGRGIDRGTDGGAGRIEDVTDRDEDDQAARDRKYEERMEDEYAKREGGA